MVAPWLISLRLPAVSEAAKDLLVFEVMSRGPKAVQEQIDARGRVTLRVYCRDPRIVNMAVLAAFRYFPALRNTRISRRRFRDTRWKTRWKCFAKPIRIRNTIAVVPPISGSAKSFHRYPVVLRIDPEMAFGTGSHPTTFLCLEALIDLAKTVEHTVPVLDLGTGSGILALAAFFLGFKKVRALDCDPEAIDVARRNFKKHRVGNHISLRCATLREDRKAPVGLLIANLIFSIIVKELPRMRRKLRKNGILVLSGLLTIERSAISRELRRRKFRRIQVTERRGWICVRAEK